VTVTWPGQGSGNVAVLVKLMGKTLREPS